MPSDEKHVHVFDSGLCCDPVVLQGIQFHILECECGALKGYGGVIVRPDEAAFYGHTEESLSDNR